MSTDLTTLLSAAGGAFLGKFVSPAAEHLGKAAWERAQQLGARATAMLAKVGREPQPVEPKLLLPLVQAGALETDETLAEKWAALLANASDPAQCVAVQPSFAEVLRQLGPLDAKMLVDLYRLDENYNNPIANLHLNRTLAISSTISGLDLTSLTVDNLLRLQLCREVESAGPGLMPSIIAGTTYGYYFIRAVTPPTH